MLLFKLRMNMCVFVIFFRVVSASKYSAIAEIVASHNNLNCIKIMHHKNIIDIFTYDFYDWIKYPTGSHRRPIGMTSLDDFNTTRTPLDQTCFNPLHVIVSLFNTSYFDFKKLSHKVNLAESRWLVMLDGPIDDYFYGASLPFSLELYVVKFLNESHADLYDVYQVDGKKPIRSLNIGFWSATRGYEINSNNVYARRTDLEGKLLRVGVSESWPIAFERYTTRGEFLWDGLFPTIWREIEKKINVTSVYIKSKSTGSVANDGSWTGLVGMATRNEIDVIVAELTQNVARTHVLAFTRQLFKSKYQIYFKEPGYILDWSAILKPFPSSLWTALFLWVILLAAAFSIFYLFYHKIKVEEHPNPSYWTVTFVFVVVQALSQQGNNRPPKTASCRILFLSCYLVAAVVVPSYSASLISSLTKKTPNLPFYSLEEMTNEGVYKLLVQKNSAKWDYFKNTNNSLLINAYNRLILGVPEFNQMTSIGQALKTVCREKHYAMFGIESIVAQHLNAIKTDCKILALPKSFTSVHLGLGLKKGHPLHLLLSNILMKMVENGEIGRISFAAWPIVSNIEVEGWTQLNLGEVFQIFAFLAFFLVVAIIILLIEIISFRYNQNKQAFYCRNI